MASLFWCIEWDWGIYTLNSTMEQAIIQAIRLQVADHSLGNEHVGRYLQEVPVLVDGVETNFSALLERIDPPFTCKVNDSTEIHIRLSDIQKDTYQPISKGSDMLDNDPSLDRDLQDMVMFETTFTPWDTQSHYMKIYESLVGIPKDLILREILSLLMPFEAKEKWSRKHYGQVLPALNMTLNKAPVIVVGGDPGTGKTALATSIGAPLAKHLNEKVHFRHLSLMLRGMGYQGRASSMIGKLFERVKEEHLALREPLLLFFDEAEAVVGARGGTDASSGAQENIAVVDAIIVGLDGLRKGYQARVAALFATNLTDRIDSALMRRSYYHSFDRPDDKVRRQLFANSLSGMNLDSSDIDKLVDATAPKKSGNTEIRFTPSDIIELIVGRAINEAIRQDKPINLNLLLSYCEKTKPTGLS